MRAVTQNAAHFLLRNDSCISSAHISCQQSPWPSLTFSPTLLKTQSLKLYTKLSERVNQGNVKLLSQKTTLSNLRKKRSKSHLNNSTPFFSLPFLIPCLRSQAQRLLQVTDAFMYFRGAGDTSFLPNSSWISKTKRAPQEDLGASTWLL